MFDAFALMDRQGRYLRSRTGVGFLTSIEPYLRVLKTTSRIAPHLDALRAEAFELGRQQIEREARPAAAAYRIEEDVVAQESALPDDGEILGFESLRRLFHDFEHPAVVGLRNGENRDISRAGRIIHSVASHLDQVKWERRTSNAQHVKSQFANLSLEQEQNHARFLLATRANAGIELLRLERVTEILDPTSEARATAEGLRAPLYVDAAAHEEIIRATVFETTRNADLPALASLVDELVRASEQLELELQRRVDTVLSRLALVERYRARAEWHDRERLEQLGATEKVAERLLRDDFARYLFDQGLDPLTEVRVGVLRADIVDPIVRPAFFVEAKRHDGQRAPESVVRDAFRQTIDTVTHLYADLRPEEAFVVIFRTGGRRLSLPAEPVAIEGLSVYVRLIDIAPAALTGSQSRENPRRFTLEELEGLALAATDEASGEPAPASGEPAPA